MENTLQRAIDALMIEDVSIRSSATYLADGYDPKFDAEVDELQVELKHLVKAFEVAEVGFEGTNQQFFRVVVDFGVRWSRPVADTDSGGDTDDDASVSELALIEATMIADYVMKQNPGEDALEQFALHNASFHIWPYWREYIYNQCQRMNLPKFMLPIRQFSRSADTQDD